MGNTMTEWSREKRKGRRRRLKIVILGILLVILAIGSYGVYAFLNVYKAANESYHPIDRGSHSKLRESDVTIGKNPISILLLGIEDYSMGGKNGHTDTMIVVTLNPHTNKMTMTSIPRDTRVPLASHNGEMYKINAAYTYGETTGYGGVKGAIDTVEGYLGIPIDYYITINFKGFVDLINEIGGVDVDVPFNFWEKDIFNHNKHINFVKGPMHLNGNEALAYVRMRKRDKRGDFGRNDRQRQVIKAAISKAVSAKTIFKVDEIASILGKNIQTNLKPSEIYALERAYSNISQSEIVSFRLDDKGHGETINKEWFLVPDMEKVQTVTEALRNELELNTGTAATTTNNVQ